MATSSDPDYLDPLVRLIEEQARDDEIARWRRRMRLQLLLIGLFQSAAGVAWVFFIDAILDGRL